MKIENIFQKISGFENITLDTILFESKYPVMFTCKNHNDIYLFICCLVSEAGVKWIGTKTNYDLLIDLLENKITIQNAFLGVEEKKIVIEYDGQNVNYHIVEGKDIEQKLLPTAGEYMDAEDGEFSEEIADFKLRNTQIEYTIHPLLEQILFIHYKGRSIMLPDEYFNLSFDNVDVTEYSISKVQGQMEAFA